MSTIIASNRFRVAALALLSILFISTPSIASASTTVNAPTLNGTATVSVAPGATIAVQVSVTTTANEDWESTSYRIGSTGNFTCVNTANFSNSGTNVATFNISTSTPGTYNLEIRTFASSFSNNDTCATTGIGNSQTGSKIVANAVTISAPAPQAQTITVTTHAPASASYGLTFPVVATASSNLPVTITTTGGCTITGGTVTMTSGTTACVVHYNQAGNASFNAATEVTENTSAITKAITVTADAKSKVVAAADPALTYQITSGTLVGSDILTGALTRAVGETAGTYPITQGTLAASSNYTLTFTPGTLTISTVVVPTITISPTTLPAGTVSASYSQNLTVGGTAVGPFTWSVSSGALPAGLTLGTSGSAVTLNGTPTSATTYNFSVQVTNGATTTSQTYSIVINGAVLPTCTPTLPNLVCDPSFEAAVGNTDTVWSQDAAGTPNAVFTVGTSGAHTGTKYANVSIANYVAGTDAKWSFTPVPVAAGQYYAFSDYYQSATTTFVYAFYIPTGGNAANPIVQFLGAAAPTAANTWAPFTSSILTDQSGTLVIAHVLQTAGSLSTDDYSLTLKPTPPVFPHGLVTLSFDDGWDTYYTNAFPILNASSGKTKNTAYIISQANVTDPTDYMTNAQVQTISASGIVEIGAHTRNHLDLVKDDPVAYNYADRAALLNGEINGSQSDLKAILPTATIDTLAYPYGSYDATTQAAVKASGFIGARSVDQGYNLTDTDSYALKQQHITNTTTFADAKGWIDTALASKTWLIFMFHDVRPTIQTCVDRAQKDVADQDCTDTALLQQIVDYLKTKEAAVPGTVVTVHEGLVAKGANQVPVIAAHTDVFAQATTTLGTFVNYVLPTVNTGAIALCAPATTTLFAIGSTTVTCSTPGATNTTFVVGVTLHAAPVAASVATTTFVGVPTPITLLATGSGVLTYATTSNPLFGTLSGTGANLVYTPQASTSPFTDSFTYKVNDGLLNSNVATATITVTLAPLPTITITPSTLVSGTADSAYTQALSASGAVQGPYTWSVSAGTLPTGLTLGTNGTSTTISGTPVASSTTTFTVSVSNGATSTSKVFTLVVNPNPVAPVITAESAATPASDSVTITWTTDHLTTSRVVYDTLSHTNASTTEASTTPNYGYANSTVEDSTLTLNHSVTVTGLTASTVYYFRTISHGSPASISNEVTATTAATPVTPPASGGGGGGSGGGGGGGFSYYGNVQLNSGAATTTTKNVTLSLNSNANQAWVSNDPAFATGGFTPLTSSISWTLSDGSGVKTVYVRFGTGSSTVASANDTIFLNDGSAPAPVTTTTGGQVLGAQTSATCFTFTKTLSIGSTGAEVTALQNSITSFGYYGGPITGYLGALTSAGVKKFQAAKGLEQTGGVGPKTRAALNTCTTGAPAPTNMGGTVQGTSTSVMLFTKTLIPGSNGDEVTSLQNLLRSLGLYKGPVTGTFGPLTGASVKVFQVQSGISPTGTVGPKTRAALNK